MADFSAWVSALPVGLLLFGATALGFTRRKAGRLLARREYPALALRLDLTLEPPRYPGWVGRLSGSYRGHRVVVEPDETARIALDLDHPIGVDLRNYEHWKRRPPGFEPFSLGLRSCDGWLVNRYCQEGLADRLHGHQALIDSLAKLRAVSDRLKQFSAADRRLECVFDFGSPSYIPAAAVEHVLGPLASLATLLAEIAPFDAKAALDDPESIS